MTRILLSVFAGAVVTLQTGCLTPASKKGMQVRDATQADVARCKFLGRVRGTSGFGNAAASVGIANSKNEARADAAELGATHIVWQSVSGSWSSYAEGEAFKCMPASEQPSPAERSPAPAPAAEPPAERAPQPVPVEPPKQKPPAEKIPI